MHPPMLHERPSPVEFLLAVIVPLAFGAVTGLMLGVSSGLYLLLALLALVGAFFAGLEHDRPLEGLYRGLLGGLLFGTGVLLAHGLTGVTPKTKLPDPEALELIITAVFAAAFSTIGAASRARIERRAQAARS